MSVTSPAKALWGIFLGTCCPHPGGDESRLSLQVGLLDLEVRATHLEVVHYRGGSVSLLDELACVEEGLLLPVVDRAGRATAQIFLELRQQNMDLLKLAAKIAGYTGEHAPLKHTDLKPAMRSIWEIYSEFHAWVDPEEDEGDDEDDDE